MKHEKRYGQPAASRGQSPALVAVAIGLALLDLMVAFPRQPGRAVAAAAPANPVGTACPGLPMSPEQQDMLNHD